MIQQHPGQHKLLEPLQAASQDTDEAAFLPQACACHGEDGRGGHGGGIDLINASSIEMVLGVVSEGRNNMPARDAIFTPEQLRDVAGYVSENIAQ